ncbi:hypothetical protein V5O48_006323, partial [Marasmius crinis-equi]
MVETRSSDRTLRSRTAIKQPLSLFTVRAAGNPVKNQGKKRSSRHSARKTTPEDEINEEPEEQGIDETNVERTPPFDDASMDPMASISRSEILPPPATRSRTRVTKAHPGLPPVPIVLIEKKPSRGSVSTPRSCSLTLESGSRSCTAASGSLEDDSNPGNDQGVNGLSTIEEEAEEDPGQEEQEQDLVLHDDHDDGERRKVEEEVEDDEEEGEGEEEEEEEKEEDEEEEEDRRRHKRVRRHHQHWQPQQEEDEDGLQQQQYPDIDDD